MQEWRDGIRAIITLSKAFFPYLLVKMPEVIVALLPVAIFSIMMDMKSMRTHAVLEFEDGEIIVPTKPRVYKLLGHSLMADCVMMAILAFLMAGYDKVALTNTVVLFGTYLLETTGAKGAIEVFRPELEQIKEVVVEN